VLLGSLVLAGSVMATLGVIQFTTGWDPVPHIRIPGLRYSARFSDIPTRSFFNRPYGTSLHPIEFGVVCAGLLPLAIHYGLHGATRRARQGAWMAVILFSVAVPMSLSRSGIIAMLVAIVFLAAGWTWTQRFTLLAYGAVFVLLMSLTIPGLLGTLRSLFTSASDDPSVVSRRERLPRVLDLIAERPWFGRGEGTYSPEDYFLLDNQYYETAIEGGIIGVVVLVLTLFVGGICIARGGRRRARSQASYHLGQAIAAPIAGFAVATYTFDALYYPAFTGILFLLIGAAGALWRLEAADPPVPVPLAGPGATIRPALTERR
jgi:O-antigen ligase